MKSATLIDPEYEEFVSVSKQVNGNTALETGSGFDRITTGLGEEADHFTNFAMPVGDFI